MELSYGLYYGSVLLFLYPTGQAWTGGSGPQGKLPDLILSLTMEGLARVTTAVLRY